MRKAISPGCRIGVGFRVGFSSFCFGECAVSNSRIFLRGLQTPAGNNLEGQLGI